MPLLKNEPASLRRTEVDQIYFRVLNQQERYEGKSQSFQQKNRAMMHLKWMMSDRYNGESEEDDDITD